jgi:hypothetical protein
MALDLTRLDRALLSPAVQKAVAGPGRMMAARGVVALPTPGELATTLYELSLDSDASIASAARTTAAGLPDKVLIGVLGDPKVDRRVLDWLAPRTKGHPALFDALIRNPAIADETVATLAGKFGDKEIEQISNNEQRLLRHPEIIAAMYTNPNARMSTVDRAVELAVRNDVRVPGLAAWDEIARALDHGVATPDNDHKVAKLVVATFGDDTEFTLGDPEAIEPGEENEAAIERARKIAEEATRDTPFRDLKVSEKIRVATLGNAFQRAEAIRDPIKLVAVAAIKGPGVTEIEAARYAGATSLPEEVIRYIASRREWTRLYSIKLSLSMNPKTSIPDASRMLPYLREKDLARVAKSKGVSSAVVAQARKLIMQRGGGKK